MKIVKESFDEMDAAYEVLNVLSNKYGKKIKDLSTKQIKDEINNWLKRSGWSKELDPNWVYEFLINDVFDEVGLNESKKLNESGMLLVHKEIYKDVQIRIYTKATGGYYYKLKFPDENRFSFTEGYEYNFKKEAINAAKEYIDINDPKNILESKSLNEELSSDKEAFLILDKLSADLKKIYDQDNYKIYEDERINKAVNDLIALEIKFPMIKELIHYVAQSTYERRYSSEDLLKKIDEVKYKFKNINKTNNKEIDENINLTRSNKTLLENEDQERVQKVLLKLRDNYDKLHFNHLMTHHMYPDEIFLQYSGLRNESIIDEWVEYSKKEIIKIMSKDVKELKSRNATINYIDKNNLEISIFV